MIERVTFNYRVFTRNTLSKYHSDRVYFTRKQYIGSIKGKEKYKKQFLHRVIWESQKGKIPLNHIIHHIDGNPLNNDIQNLESIPIQSHGKRYHRHLHVRIKSRDIPAILQ